MPRGAPPHDQHGLEDPPGGIGLAGTGRPSGVRSSFFGSARRCRTLLIDNYDSFTYNLFQLLAEVNGAEPLVVRNDEAFWPELERFEFDNVVISPGPGPPRRAADFGVCAEAIRRCEVRCWASASALQGIGWVEGGRVERVPEPMHGPSSRSNTTARPSSPASPARLRRSATTR